MTKYREDIMMYLQDTEKKKGGAVMTTEKDKTVLTEERKETDMKLLSVFALISPENQEKAILFLEGMAAASTPRPPKVKA